jgi:hypothetical protein
MMRAEYRERINWAIGLFAVLFLLGLFVRANLTPLRPLAQLFGIASLVPLVWAFWLYAESKGQVGFWGLLGLIPFIGVIALLLLPDKTRPCPTLPLSADTSAIPQSPRPASSFS